MGQLTPYIRKSNHASNFFLFANYRSVAWMLLEVILSEVQYPLEPFCPSVCWAVVCFKLQKKVRENFGAIGD